MEFFIWVLVVVLMTAIGYRAMIIVAMGFVAAGIVLPSLFGILSGLWKIVTYGNDPNSSQTSWKLRFKKIYENQRKNNF